MNIVRSGATCAFLASLTIPAALLSASPVAILNASFEEPLVDAVTAVTPYHDPIPGWEKDRPYQAALWNPGIKSYDLLLDPAPAGNQIAYVGISGEADAYLKQVLSASLQPNTVYTLTGFVGGIAGYVSEYTVSLRSGEHELASISATAPEATFESFTVSFDSTGSGLIGQPLEIRLLTATPQTAFDGIALDAESNNTVAPGDFNSDGLIDGSDFLQWQRTFGSTTELGADGSGNGTVDTADLNLWRVSYGPSADPIAFTVPEPSTPQLAALASLSVLLFRALLCKCAIHSR